ncbi:hypothetical protein IAU59_007431 [Kwoniella sp. CBS 9459]
MPTIPNPHEITYEYTEAIDPNLACAICYSALVDPVTTISCKHTFCRDCIVTAIGVNSKCPIDRSDLTLGSLRDTEQLVKLMLDELKVRCVADDCGQVMQRGLLLSHIRSCPKTVITCGDADCGFSMARHRLPHHRAYECFQRNMECAKCGNMLVFKDRKVNMKPDCCQEEAESCGSCGQTLGTNRSTHQWTCPSVRVPCPHLNRGCAAIVSRSSLQQHLDQCPFENLATFFEINDARFKAVEERNELLQAELGVLRADLAGMRSDPARIPGVNTSTGRRDGPLNNEELSARALTARMRRSFDAHQVPRMVGQEEAGVVDSMSPSTPVGRRVPPPDEVNANATPDRGQVQFEDRYETQSSAAALQGISTPSLHPHINIRPSPTSPGSSPYAPLPGSTPTPTSTGNTTDLSNSNGAGGMGITARAAADLAHSHNPRSFVAPSFGSHQSYADWAFNRLYLQGQAYGLNQGNGQAQGQSLTALDEVISALRGVVVHLAAGLDTMERRHEVRTMTESLRVLEEVGSLRAIVTTMRMQVMMDRPIRSPPLSPPLDQPFAFSTVLSPPPPAAPYLYNSATTTATESASADPTFEVPQSAVSISRTSSLSTSPANTRESASGSELPEGDGEPVSEDTYLDPERPHSIRESVVFSGPGPNNLALGRGNNIFLADGPGTSSVDGTLGNSSTGIGLGIGDGFGSSRSSLVISVNGRSRRGGRSRSERRIVGTIGSGAGLMGKTMGIPPPDHGNDIDNDRNDGNNDHDNVEHDHDNDHDDSARSTDGSGACHRTGHSRNTAGSASASSRSGNRLSRANPMNLLNRRHPAKPIDGRPRL